jgi:hypothetical protein
MTYVVKSAFILARESQPTARRNRHVIKISVRYPVCVPGHDSLNGTTFLTIVVHDKQKTALVDHPSDLINTCRLSPGRNRLWIAYGKRLVQPRLARAWRNPVHFSRGAASRVGRLTQRPREKSTHLRIEIKPSASCLKTLSGVAQVNSRGVDITETLRPWVFLYYQLLM